MDGQNNQTINSIPIFNTLVTLHNGLNDPVFIADDTMTIVWGNESAKRKYPAIMAPNGLSLLFPDINKSDLIERLRCTKSSIHSDQLALPDVQVRISPIFDKERFSGGIITLFSNDVGSALNPGGSERAISAISGQFRNPLALIFSALSSVNRRLSVEETPEGLSEQIDVITQNCYRLLRTSTVLTDYLRYSGGVHQLQPKRVNLVTVIKELANALSLLTIAIGIPLETDLPEGDLIVMCDAKQLCECIIQAVSNSCRFTREDNQITISLKQVGDYIIVSVADRGIGIPANRIEKVFDPYCSFSQDNQPFAGSGLGLTLIRLSIQEMGGTVVLNSIENKGTTIAFNLPLKDDPNQPLILGSNTLEYLSNRFSPVYVGLSDVCPCPIS